MEKKQSDVKIDHALNSKPRISQEPDRVSAAERIYSVAQTAKWKPGQPRMSREDHMNLIGQSIPE